jgi:hypothetical protein
MARRVPLSVRSGAAALGLGSLAVVAAPGAAPAFDIDGFLPSAGQGDLAISHTFEAYDEFWVGDTEVEDPGVGRVETGSLSLWMQYGLTDDVALLGNVAYVDAASDGAGGFAANGLQDRAVMLKARLKSIPQGRAQHSFVAGFGVSSPASGYEANSPVDLGDGTTDVLLRLVWLWQGPSVYFSQQLGYDIRDEDAPDGIPLHSALGVTVRRVTAIAMYSGHLADGGTDIGDPGFTFPSNGDEYHRFGAKLYTRLSERTGASIAAFTTVDGRNAGKATGFSAGVNFGI